MEATSKNLLQTLELLAVDSALLPFAGDDREL